MRWKVRFSRKWTTAFYADQYSVVYATPTTSRISNKSKSVSPSLILFEVELFTCAMSQVPQRNCLERDLLIVQQWLTLFQLDVILIVKSLSICMQQNASTQCSRTLNSPITRSRQLTVPWVCLDARRGRKRAVPPLDTAPWSCLSPGPWPAPETRCRTCTHRSSAGRTPPGLQTWQSGWLQVIFNTDDTGCSERNCVSTMLFTSGTSIDLEHGRHRWRALGWLLCENLTAQNGRSVYALVSTTSTQGTSKHIRDALREKHSACACATATTTTTNTKA